MMNNMYEVLEVCLIEMDRGVDIDSLLFRYPEFADELRPILEASVAMRKMSAPVPSREVMKRNRARVLQHAAELRERNASTVSRRIWSVPLRRALASLVVVVMLFASGTGLVRASSNTVPGDNLYSVKRSWEGFTLFFTFDATKREELELAYENERLEELHELFAEGRSESVDFSGYVKRQSTDELRVSGITVLITPQTHLPDQSIMLGDGIRVTGRVQEDGTIVAEEIELVPVGTRLPEVEDNELEGTGDDEGNDAQSSTLQIKEGIVERPSGETKDEYKSSDSNFELEDVSLNGGYLSVNDVSDNESANSEGNE